MSETRRSVLPRSTVELDGASMAYTDTGGDGPVALFVHGVFLNADLWRNVIAPLAGVRRCIAVDLPGHGESTYPVEKASSLAAVADLLARVCDATGAGAVDLVANDTGGAVAQVFAARHPDRVRTLTLTNCDVHDNLPPARFRPVVELARQGALAPGIQAMASDLAMARSEAGLGAGYEHAEDLPDDVVRSFLGRYAEEANARELELMIASLQADELMAIEPDLRRFDAPTLIVWGTGDVFFEPEWARWLERTIPGVRNVVEVPGAKLFFPDERAADLVPHLRAHWETALAPA